jgi:hypothetical protein
MAYVVPVAEAPIVSLTSPGASTCPGSIVVYPG